MGVSREGTNRCIVGVGVSRGMGRGQIEKYDQRGVTLKATIRGGW